MSKYTSKFTGAEIDEKLSKVNQEYTIGEKTKLAALENYDDSELVAAVSELETNKANKNDVYNKTETDNAITTKVAELVAGAPEEFDTLKEMSDWLTEHEDSAAAMNTAIQKNAADIASNKSAIESNDNDIAEVKNDIAVNRATLGIQCKNIFDYSTWVASLTAEKGNVVKNDDDSITITATENDAYTVPYAASASNLYKLSVEPNRKYVLSWDSDGSVSGRVYVFRNGISSDAETVDNNTNKSIEFTTETDTTFVTIRFGVTAAGNSITYSNIMIRLADITDDTYEPYVPSVVEQLDNKLGKTETAAAAVKDGAGGNIAEQFADIAARHDYGYAYSGSSQRGWHKAAECTFSAATTRQAVFLVTGHESTICGALSVSVTSSGSPNGIEELGASWIYRTSSINPGYFVAVAKCTDGVIQAELWVKLTNAWQPIKLNQVSSTSRIEEVHDDTAWKVCNSAVASESYPTDYDLTYVSVDNSAATYDASGNDITATYLTHGVGTLIPSNSDLNDSAYIVPGVYRAGNNAIAATLLNCPTKYGFRMEVKATIGVDRPVRLIYPNLDNGTYFMQNVTADGFGSWYKFSGEVVTTSATTE